MHEAGNRQSRASKRERAVAGRLGGKPLKPVLCFKPPRHRPAGRRQGGGEDGETSLSLSTTGHLNYFTPVSGGGGGGLKRSGW